MVFLEKNKKYIIVISLFVGIAVCVLILSMVHDKKTIIETSKRNEDSSLPKIKIQSKDMEALNQELERLYQKYTSDGKSKFNYQTSTYDDIVSILVSIDEYSKDTYSYQKKFLSYNINQLGEYLEEEEIANKFGTNMENVISKVLNQLRIYYLEEDELEYFVKEECDFSCYLSFVRNIENIQDHIALVIENNSLVAYMDFDTNSFYEDQEYFDSLQYDFYKVKIVS